MARAQGWSVDAVKESEYPLSVPKGTMEGLVPKSFWPKRWVEIGREASDGMLLLRMGHVSPNPNESVGGFANMLEQGVNSGAMPGMSLAQIAELRKSMAAVQPENTEFGVMDLIINGYGNKKMAEQAFGNYLSMGAGSAGIPGLSGMDQEKFMGMMEKFAPPQAVKGFRKAMVEARAKRDEAGAKSTDGNYLGQRAAFLAAKGGKDEACMAVIIGNFVVSGGLVNRAQTLKPGSTPCGENGKSTYAREGYLHKEEAERVLRDMFAIVRAASAAVLNAPLAEVSGGKAAAGIGLDEKAVVKTSSRGEMDLSNGKNGDRIHLGPATEMRIISGGSFGLEKGSISIMAQKGAGEFEVTSPLAVVKAGGNVIFAVYASADWDSVTVVRGQAELSGRHGKGKVTVKENQMCTISKKGGMGKPAALPPRASI